MYVCLYMYVHMCTVYVQAHTCTGICMYVCPYVIPNPACYIAYTLITVVINQKGHISTTKRAKVKLTHYYLGFLFIQVSWTMLAITVAVRIDIYGVYYAVALGLLFLVPRRFLPPVWFLYLVLHGVLLVAQYGFLLGVPPGLCLGHGGNQSMLV